jgi:hypothetical protein
VREKHLDKCWIIAGNCINAPFCITDSSLLVLVKHTFCNKACKRVFDWAYLLSS